MSPLTAEAPRPLTMAITAGGGACMARFAYSREPSSMVNSPILIPLSRMVAAAFSTTVTAAPALGASLPARKTKTPSLSMASRFKSLKELIDSPQTTSLGSADFASATPVAVAEVARTLPVAVVGAVPGVVSVIDAVAASASTAGTLSVPAGAANADTESCAAVSSILVTARTTSAPAITTINAPATQRARPVAPPAWQPQPGPQSAAASFSRSMLLVGSRVSFV